MKEFSRSRRRREGDDGASSEPDAAATASSKRSRKAGHITENACTECKRQRVKCDGGHPCSRCAARPGRDCAYDVNSRIAKRTMLEQMHRLDAQCRAKDQILQAIASNENADAIVQQLMEGQAHESIASQIASVSSPGSGETMNGSSRSVSVVNESAAGMDRDESQDIYVFDADHRQVTSSQLSKELDRVPESTRERTRNAFDSSKPGTRGGSADLVDNEHREIKIGPDMYHFLQSESSVSHPDNYANLAQTWTNVTADRTFIEHLLSLYFCWEYPTITSLSKKHFICDFTSGRTRFCSSLLVNALLSLACIFSDRSEARADPSNSDTVGDHFFQEAKTLLISQGDPSLTTIQALALMSLREASFGRQSIGCFYAAHSIRMAVESGLHKDHTALSGETFSTEEREVRSITFWGCFALDQAWSLHIGRVPYLLKTKIRTPLPVVADDMNAQEWIPYTDRGLSRMEAGKSPRNNGLVFHSLCELSTRINDALSLVYTPGSGLTNQKLLKVYKQYLGWYGSLPGSLRQGQNFTPCAFFVHIYYHYSVLLLLRPFLNSPFEKAIPSARDTCVQATENITALMRSYGQLHTLRRIPTFLPYIIADTGFFHLLDANAPVVSPSSFMSLEDLRDMCACSGFAKQIIDILIALAHQRDHGGSENHESSSILAPKHYHPASSSATSISPNSESHRYQLPERS